MREAFFFFFYMQTIMKWDKYVNKFHQKHEITLVTHKKCGMIAKLKEKHAPMKVGPVWDRCQRILE